MAGNWEEWATAWRNTKEWLPSELMLLVVLAALLFFLFGFRRLAFSLLAAILLVVFFPPLFSVARKIFPPWITYTATAGVVVVGLHKVSTLVLGKGATAEMVGSLAADTVKALLKGVRRAARWLLPP